jgi:hypothetical protein
MRNETGLSFTSHVYSSLFYDTTNVGVNKLPTATQSG